MRQRGLPLILVPVVLAILGGCTTIEGFIASDARVDYKKGYDFDHIDKVIVAPGGYGEYRPSLLSPEQSERINLALVRALGNRGMQVVETIGEADAIVDWHVVTEERSTVRSYNAESYYQCWRCGPSISDRSVSTHTVGTFIVDIIDPGLSKSVWRGLIQGRFAEVSKMAIEQEKVDAAADEILSRFPPGLLIDGIY